MRKLKITELNRIGAKQFKIAKKIPLVVVLDNVRSLHNVGSVFRTSDAFLVEAVWLCGITATPPHAEIHKTALGAEDSVGWRYFKTTQEAVDELRSQRYLLIGVEQAENSISPEDLPMRHSKYAIIFGNEVHGIAQDILDCCNYCIEIQQFGTKHSLNVSVAAGIVIRECFKKLK